VKTHQYNVNIHWDSDRKGMMCSPEITETKPEKGCIEVATPPQFPKGIPGIWSPEHLFTAAVSSCFMTTFLAIAENSKLDFTSFDCSAIGVLDKIDDKFLMTEVILEPLRSCLANITTDRIELSYFQFYKIKRKYEASCQNTGFYLQMCVRHF